MGYNEADTRAKLIDPALHSSGWTVTRQEIEEKNYDLKAVNPNKVEEVDTRTPEELINIIEEKGKEVQEALAILKEL